MVWGLSILLIRCGESRLTFLEFKKSTTNVAGHFVLRKHVLALPLFCDKYGSFHMAQCYNLFVLVDVGNFTLLRAASVGVQRFTGRYVRV